MNISSIQFRRGDVEDTVLRALAASGATPAALELELTESAIMQNIDSSVEILNSLKAMGIQISIDDFGIGHSSVTANPFLPSSLLFNFLAHLPQL